ncbi:hypothetical protein GOP47_0010491 [Adiantum capillus-veneris]|uniref:Uncharacterized protein n=1 Tax=Adiantum capillus-veneris TaxID=13818 RepID=A0A9D4ZIU6_ADICA|nr:hypothetical protein GOP47_0010491 [Adiantum capillus-veneris]
MDFDRDRVELQKLLDREKNRAMMNEFVSKVTKIFGDKCLNCQTVLNRLMWSFGPASYNLVICEDSLLEYFNGDYFYMQLLNFSCDVVHSDKNAAVYAPLLAGCDNELHSFWARAKMKA